MAGEHDEKRGAVEAWDRVARSWARHWPVFEAGAGSLGERMVELAGVGPESRVLDLATGVGEPALTAARVVWPGGRVVAVDHSQAMVSLALKRAEDAGLDNVEGFRASAEELDTSGREFDAVLCRWGLMLFDDPDAALQRMRRALVPGGRLVAAVWSTADRMPMLRILHDAIRGAFDPPPPEPGEPGVFTMSDADALEERVRRAGFDDVTTERFACRFTFDSPAAYRQFEEEVSMTMASAIADEPEDKVQAARRLLEEGVARYVDETGRVVLPCEAIIVSGRRIEASAIRG